MAFLAALMVCIGTLFYQGSKFSTLKKNNLALEKELALFSPMVSQDTILQDVNRIKLQSDAVRQYAQKYLGLAVIGEISDMTPENVRLMNLRLQQTAGSPAAAGQKTEHNGLVLEGIIFNKKDMLESDLTQYVLKLENSALFNTVSVQSKNIINFDKKDVIHFVISAKQGS
jgi:Tfp pilus assembly protein PilN